MFPIGPELIAGAEIVMAMQRTAAAVIERSAFAFHGAALGARMSVLVNTADEVEAHAALARAEAEIARLDAILNWRDPDSELSVLNRSRMHVASADLFNVVETAEHWRKLTDGAYSGRLGRVLDVWRNADGKAPCAADLRRLAEDAHAATVGLDRGARAIVRPDAVCFDLDAIAKGYIVDCVLRAAVASSAVVGALIDIGGEVACAGEGPGGGDWLIGVPQPLARHDNAMLAGCIMLRDRAVATSGCGPRDLRLEGSHVSATLDPHTGSPISTRRSATVIAASAMQADALATALIVMPLAKAARLMRSLPDAAARITDGDQSTWLEGGTGASGAPPQWTPVQAKTPQAASPAQPAWHERWVAMVTFSAPPKQLRKERAFRSPYVAIWVSDMQNRPVRTLVLIGSIKEWQEGNYIWWGLNRERAMQFVDARSMSTRGSGEYKLLWDGIDDEGRPVPAGKYIVHVETSRERGRHTHRMLELDFTKPEALSAEIPMSEESGRLLVSYERF